MEDLEHVRKVVEESTSFSDVCRKLNIPINGAGIGKAQKLVYDYKLTTDHFVKGTEKNRKYPLVEKECPICDTVFQASVGSPREKITCSHSCSNVYFSDLRNKPHNFTNYRTICFYYWEKKCAICGFDKILDVHHIDEDRNNNNKDNLIPLCKNHHGMVHTKRYGDDLKLLIQEIANTRKSSLTEATVLKNKNFNNRASHWPELDNLREMVKLKGYEAVGRELGVTGAAVKKKLKLNGIEIPKYNTQLKSRKND